MCGATEQQTDIANEQQQFYSNAIQQQQQAWGDDQEILSAMKNVYQPIFNAGPSQQGFSSQERAAMNTQVTEGTAQNYAAASKAVGEQLAAQGGGNVDIASGGAAQLKAQVAQSAAQEMSQEQNQITQADWQQGYNNWLNAAQGMSETAQLYNPLGYSGAATNAGSAAGTTANQIAQENNSWINAALGAAGSVGSAVVGENPGNIFG
jgi:hypothetical protein